MDIPNRASDAGPEAQNRDATDWNYEASEFLQAARRAGNDRDRIRYTMQAINCAGESLALLLGPEPASQEDAELAVTLAKADLTLDEARALGKSIVN
jgi:hypothetical protein